MYRNCVLGDGGLINFDQAV